MDIKEKKQLLLEMKKKYLALKRNIPSDIRNQIKANEVIQGERALEMQLPKHLQRRTKDYDIYSETPKQSAEELRDYLNEQFKGEYFKVRAAKHRGTYKVKSTIDEETFADYSKTPKRLQQTTIGETKYSALAFEMKKALRTLQKKKFEYRKRKEHGRLRRIKKYLKSRWF